MPVWIYVKHSFLKPITFLKKGDCDFEIWVTCRERQVLLSWESDAKNVERKYLAFSGNVQ